MKNNTLGQGVVHTLPEDLRKALLSSLKAQTAWNAITPLARNEWICWTISVKKEETRKEHVQRTVSQLAQGKRRPCCWIGCIHREDRPMSASQKYILNKKAGKK